VPVTAVTNLGAWYQFDFARYKTKGLSADEKEEISNNFFLPHMSSIPSGRLTFKYARTPIFWEAVWTFLFVELFDSFGTLTGIMTRAGFMKGDPEKAMTRVNRAMCVDGFGLWLGAIIGSNSITCYIESNTGVEAGARTGLASVVTGSAFFLSLLFIGPFVAVIPDAATTCALVMVGVFSLEGVRDINFDDITESLPAFFTIMTMGFTYSIANGICAGFIWFAFMRTVRFCYQKIALKVRPAAAYPAETDCAFPHPLMIIIAIFCAVRFAYLAPGHQ
jgi:AGZA family xanthine/uracil permease-like MFS transporter